jgi:hypothetical protein
LECTGGPRDSPHFLTVASSDGPRCDSAVVLPELGRIRPQIVAGLMTTDPSEVVLCVLRSRTISNKQGVRSVPKVPPFGPVEA